MISTDVSICLSTLLPDPFSIDPDTFDNMLDAAAAAGFSGVSWWTLHHLFLEQAGLSGDEQLARIRARGLSVTCLEALAGWGNAASPVEAVAEAEMALALNDHYGADHLVAVVMDAELADYDQTVANLAAIAARAADHDVTVCVEFLPWSAIGDIGTCHELLRRTEADNVTVLLDSWHWQRQAGGPGGANAEILASMDPGYFGILQVCDALAEAQDDVMGEAMTQRPIPGQGVVDNAALLDLIDAAGADIILCPEVFNHQVLAEGPDVLAAAVGDATRALVAERS